MADFQRRRLRWLSVIIAVGLAGTLPAARAQVADEAPEQPAPEPPQITMTPEQFQHWISEAALGSEDGSVDARTSLETILALKIEHLERACGISGSQKRKLQLAGRGDIKRFFDRVADQRRRYEQVKDNQQELGKLQTEIQQLASLRGKPMFEEGSIFGKTLLKLLTADQVVKIETAARQSRRFRHRAKVDLVVQSLDVVAGLSDEQRERLTRVLLRETRPARNSSVDFDVEIVFAQAGDLPESKIKAIFDQDQWRAVAPLLQTLKQSYQATLHDVALEPDNERRLHPSELAETSPAPTDSEKFKGK
jgi:hypothetical protein